MPSTHLIKRVRATPEQIFDLVADVERYPEFINLISNLRITKTISESEFEAEAVVAYKIIRESFLSHIKLDRAGRTIKVTKASKGGAVKVLENKWSFHELSDGSTAVNFYVDVSLKAFPLNILVGQKMDRATEVIMGAFERRAAQVCGVVGGEEPSAELRAELAAVRAV